MTRTALALILLAACPAATALSTRTADPERVVQTFVDVCTRSPHAWGSARSVALLGGAPVTADDATPAAGASPTTRYTLAIDRMPVQLALADGVCEMTVDAIDVTATLARFDAAIAADYAGVSRYEPAQAPAAPPAGAVLRDLHFAMGNDAYGKQFRVVAPDAADGQRLVLIDRTVSMATGEPQAPDMAPSEDLAGRVGKPPRYPGGARRECAGGLVLTRVTIDDEGSVLDATVERTAGRRDLDAAAIDAVRGWRYFPGILDGVRVGGDVRVPISFASPCRR